VGLSKKKKQKKKFGTQLLKPPFLTAHLTKKGSKGIFFTFLKDEIRTFVLEASFTFLFAFFFKTQRKKPRWTNKQVLTGNQPPAFVLFLTSLQYLKNLHFSFGRLQECCLVHYLI
jgi:hypothetical protein